MDLHHFRQDYLENLIINNKIHWWNAVLVLNNVRSSSLQTNSKVRNAFYQWMVVFMIKISIQSCLISYVYIVICFLRSCSCDFIHLDNRLSLFNSAYGQLTYVWRSAVFLLMSITIHRRNVTTLLVQVAYVSEVQTPYMATA